MTPLSTTLSPSISLQVQVVNDLVNSSIVTSLGAVSGSTAISLSLPNDPNYGFEESQTGGFLKGFSSSHSCSKSLFLATTVTVGAMSSSAGVIPLSIGIGGMKVDAKGAPTGDATNGSVTFSAIGVSTSSPAVWAAHGLVSTVVPM
ncbi:hypothetical protein SUGI_1189480 [Cryptomeria japonica]|nr:hypothetical protein SUGI_1189480 [Cryptomeria japonica]